jgi:hypothetical protein
MTSLALELYQVLEDEYVSMYGPLDGTSPLYNADDILNLYRVRAILRECGLPAAEDAQGVADQLSGLVSGTASLAPLAESPAITDCGTRLLEDYGKLSELAEKKDSRVSLQELRRTIVDDAFTDVVRPLRDIRLDKVYAALHERARGTDGKPRTALCISGGGIRSATFALGVMQGFASAKILDKFDFLSTVSGGGYIGSWLSSWMRRHQRGAAGVQEELHQADTAVAESQASGSRRKLNPEPEPLRHLRAYSNYLSPRLGLLSGDSWTMASLYIRNLLLNLLVLVPLLALALSFPRIFSALLEWSSELDKAHFPRRAWAWLAAVFFTAGFAYLGQKRPVAQGRRAQRKENIAATDGHILLFVVLPLALGATALAVFWARVKALPPPVPPRLLSPEQVDLLCNPWTVAAAVLALLGMTLLPYLLYYRRVSHTLLAEQRKAFADARKRKAELRRKKRAEFGADFVALLTTAVLLWLLAVKVFDDPLRPVPILETLPPILRAGQAASPQAQLYACFIVPLILLVFFVQASIFVGLSSYRNEDYDREWWGRAGAWLLAIAVGLGLLNAAAVFGPIAFYYAPVILASVGGGAGIASALLGFSGSTPANQREKEEGGLTAKAGNLASAVTVPLFVVALLAAISLGTTWIVQKFGDDPKVTPPLTVSIPPYGTNDPKIVQPDEYSQAAQLQSKYTQTKEEQEGLTLSSQPSPRANLPALRAIAHLQIIQQTGVWEVLSFLGVALFGFTLSYFIGVNKFSMHALYRNRLIRAYLGASRYQRDPDRFTGFDENDNLKMWELRPELLWITNLHDVEGLRDALMKKVNPLAAFLWETFDDETKKALQEKIDYVSTQTLVENLNDILLTRDLPADVPAPAWATTKAGQIAYPRAMINRAILDEHFNQWITPMTPPADAAGAPNGKLSRGPFHIVNTALNLTSGDNLAWQQRMAESFTVSPYHSGSLFLGYRASREYGGEISLGTAVTISGAAASPNMGYHSSPLMAFLLTFFNIRLGSWLGNPGPYGQATYYEKHPSTSLRPLFEELTGNSNDTSKWIYLSDGGHFENLGLYEMVVRRCHRIVVSDGGADPDYAFEDLGNAIRKIRTDLGIPIDVEKITMGRRAKDGKPVAGEYFAFATIRYSAVDKNAVDGTLLYIKPGVYQRDQFPWDVYNYAQESLEFPHEPTSDQFFSESQFESYRALGRYAFHDICKSSPVAKTYASVDEFFSSVEQCRAIPEILDSGD